MCRNSVVSQPASPRHLSARRRAKSRTKSPELASSVRSSVHEWESSKKVSLPRRSLVCLTTTFSQRCSQARSPVLARSRSKLCQLACASLYFPNHVFEFSQPFVCPSMRRTAVGRKYGKYVRCHLICYVFLRCACFCRRSIPSWTVDVGESL